MTVHTRRSPGLIEQLVRRAEEQERLGKRGFGLALFVIGMCGLAISHTALENYFLAAVYWLAFCFTFYLFCQCWRELRALDPWRMVERHKRPAE